MRERSRRWRGLAGTGHLVVLVRKTDEAYFFAQLLERDVQLLGLLDGAAEVVLCVDDQERSAIWRA
jgi:tRNA pseudouridine-54 N-methylase